jgi:hypothetical protein
LLMGKRKDIRQENMDQQSAITYHNTPPMSLPLPPFIYIYTLYIYPSFFVYTIDITAMFEYPCGKPKLR